MKKSIGRMFFLVFLSLAATEAAADWTGCWIFDDKCLDYEIADIFSDVAKANKALNKNRPVMNLYLDQREQWLPYREKAQLVAEAVIDVLEKLPPLRDEFWGFVGYQEKCARGTGCAKFQAELIGFFDEMSALQKRLPVIKKAGLKDRDLIARAVMKTPPVMLFALHRGLKRVPDWNSLPGDLSDILDEIDDAEVFDLDLQDTWNPVNRDSTKTQRFCAKRADKFDGIGRGPNGNRDGWDQIRVNRMTLVVSFSMDLWKYALGLIPDDIDIGAAILGEGATLGIPSSLFTWFIEAVPTAVDVTMKSLEVHRQNIEICKSRFAEVEGRLSSCRYFSEFVLDQAARDEYYDLVQRRFEMADKAGISTGKSNRFYRASVVKLGSDQYHQAYENLCEAYQYIGVAK